MLILGIILATWLVGSVPAGLLVARFMAPHGSHHAGPVAQQDEYRPAA